MFEDVGVGFFVEDELKVVFFEGFVRVVCCEE